MLTGVVNGQLFRAIRRCLARPLIKIYGRRKMKLSVIWGTVCLVLLVTASASFSQQCPYKAGSPLNWCIPHNEPHYYYVPKRPADPYSAPNGGSGREPPTYAIPTVPTNPYTPSPSHTPLPAATSYPAPIPFAPANPYATSGSAFSYKCVISNAGDYCIGASSAPASSGAGCVCGGQYNGYVE
jgi:hypothetical protein